jgi:hypothetical protein
MLKWYTGGFLMKNEHKKMSKCAGAALCMGIVLLSGLFAQSFDGQFMGPPPPGGMPPGPMMNDVVPDLTGVRCADGKNGTAVVTVGSRPVNSDQRDVSVLLARNGGVLSATGAVLSKSGDTTDMNQSNFYGLNAAVAAAGGSSLTLNDCRVESSAEGANGIFSTGAGSVITIKNTTITTHRNSSRGLDATYGGTVVAENVSITTDGAHCAALATDRGEGTVTVHGGTAATAGDGSPVIYSTGAITAENMTGTATGAEIAAIEGKNSITLRQCVLTGSANHGIMLYQSFSGDAGVGTSVFTAQDCQLTSGKDGPFFYITNTTAKIELQNSTISHPSGPLILASGNDGMRGWGKAGANGGKLTFFAHDQQLSGDIVCDAISSVDFSLGSASSYTGAVNSGHSGVVNLTLDAAATWTVSGDSHIGSLTDGDTSFHNITSAGFTVYYDSQCAANKYLGGRVYTLNGGGKLTPEV